MTIEGKNRKEVFSVEQKKDERTGGNLNDEQLDDIAGGYSYESIKLCVRCKIRIAVQGMEMCGLCYRETRL